MCHILCAPLATRGQLAAARHTLGVKLGVHVGVQTTKFGGAWHGSRDQHGGQHLRAICGHLIGAATKSAIKTKKKKQQECA